MKVESIAEEQPSATEDTAEVANEDEESKKEETSPEET